MKTKNSAHSKTSIWLGVLFCMELVFCVALAGCGNKILRKFDRLEKEALKYGTVSVGAARVIDYDEQYLKDSKERLRNALENIRKNLANEPNTSSSEQTADGSDSNKKPDKTQEKKTDKTREKKTDKTKKSEPESEQESKPENAKVPILSDIEAIGLRMAAFKFIESELEDINLADVLPTECNFRRVVVSLDCSAWVRGKAGAALVYIDLYPYKADDWCHEAAKILEKWWKEIKKCDSSKELEIQKQYECSWNKVTEEEFKDVFKDSSPPAIVPMPEKKEIDKKRDPRDWVAFCHRWLHKKELLPDIVQVERMGRAEYLTLAEADYSTSKFGIGIKHPTGPSAQYETETRKEQKRQMESVRQLSLTFVAGERRAGWLFMPGKTTEGKMAPTERRLRMVVDVPKELKTLAIHVHKVFLGPDLGILDGAAFSKQVEYLDKTMKKLTDADVLYKDYQKTMPRHYRLIKTRMRNLLFQGWAEEIPVDMPKSKRDCCRDAKKSKN